MNESGMDNYNDAGRMTAAEIQEFNEFAQFLQDACGISLGPNKQYLVATRINRILLDNGIHSLGALLPKLAQPSCANLRNQIIDAMTTNETYWFRDAYPFEYLKDSLLPELFANKNNSGEIRIWSAACSTGQEPFSLSMVVEEYKQKNLGYCPLNIKILATDLSGTALEVAQKSIYDKLSMARGLTSDRMQRFFRPHTGTAWQVIPAVRQRVEFRSMNLLDNYQLLGKFDIIFCRNVLIYFSAQLKHDILTRLHAALNPNGILCLGSSEGLSNIPNLFDMIQCSPGIMYRAK